MPRLDYKRCRNCGRFSKDTGPLSHSRLCPRCGHDRLESNIVQMATLSGPNFTKWRHGMIRCAGGIVVDNSTSTH
jgi:RNA polymerase subunit RPABC4/transcription elongation factor Spt4